ncbi:MAG: 30S ribosomal protein S2 [Cyanobacteriota bacterium]
MSKVSVQELLEAGVHFGHQTKKWNPKMKKYIFGERKKVYIINLHQTSEYLDKAYDFVKGMVAEGRNILFVGTKKQAQDAMKDAAEKTGMFYINERWLGGMLTNFSTIKARINYLKELETKKKNGYFDNLNKKEVSSMEKEIEKLTKILGGIKDMHRVPDVLFIVDIQKEHLAVKEAKKLNIPIVAIVDTNCNPDDVDFVIPGNDDAIKAVNLLTSKITDAITEGKSNGVSVKPAVKAEEAKEEVKEVKVEEEAKAE